MGSRVKYFGDRVDPVAAGNEDQKSHVQQSACTRTTDSSLRGSEASEAESFPCFLRAKCKHGDESRRVGTARLFYLLVRPIDAKKPAPLKLDTTDEE